MESGELEIPMVDAEHKIVAFSMEDRIAEIAQEKLISGGYVKGISTKPHMVEYYKKHATEAFIIQGKYFQAWTIRTTSHRC